MYNFLVEASYLIHFVFDWKVVAGIALLILLCLVIQKEYNQVKIFTLGLALTGILTICIKNIAQVDRPTDALIGLSDYAFPSGHSSLSFFFLFFLINYIMLTHKNISTKIISISIFTLFTLIICVSRLLLHVHTIDQVIAGALLGIVVAIWTMLKITPTHNFLSGKKTK